MPCAACRLLIRLRSSLPLAASPRRHLPWRFASAAVARRHAHRRLTPNSGWLQLVPFSLPLLAGFACPDALGPEARLGNRLALVAVSGAALPGLIAVDSVRTVRIVADTLRFLPDSGTYRQELAYDVLERGRADVVVRPSAPGAPRVYWDPRNGAPVDLDAFAAGSPIAGTASALWQRDTLQVYTNAAGWRFSYRVLR